MFATKNFITQDHMTLSSKIENVPVFKSMVTHKVNKTLHDSGELPSHYYIWKTNEKIDDLDAGKYKIIKQLPSNHNEKENTWKLLLR